MTRLLTLVLALAILCPALSIAKEKPNSLKACLPAPACLVNLPAGYADRSLIARPAIRLADEPYCPENKPMPNQCRCDHKETCNVECCEAKFECDDHGYCICRGNCEADN